MFDGMNSIGGNKIHLESADKGVFLDFGTNFKRMSQFYEEYLKPRAVRGIHDYLALKIVPPLDVYCEYLIPSDLDHFRFQAIRSDGVLLTHAHMDHAGCIGLLKTRVPVYSSAMTAAILKAYQDSGKTEVPCEAVYSTPRERSDEQRVLDAIHYRSAEGKHIGRDFFVVTHCTKELTNFWQSTPDSRGLKPGELREVGDGESPLPFKAFEVDHSIYGATAYAVETEDGWVVYTGDLRAHGIRKNKTRRFVREASKLDPKALIIEGTRIGRKEVENVSEEEVYKKCLSAALDEDKLVIADFPTRDFERLETFLRIANDTKRKLVVTLKDAYALEAVGLVDGVDRMKNLLIYRDLKGKRDKWEQNILERFDEILIDPNEVASDPKSYILCFSFWDVKNLLDIKTKGGIYVFSSSEAFTEEAEIDFVRLWNWLQFFKLKAIGFRVEISEGSSQVEFDHGYHASGHASPKELLQIVEDIDPKIVIPIHTENPKFFKENAKGRDVRLLENGEKTKI
jgi:ribonuclease J